MKDRGSWRPVFDDKSRFLDRYGRLLGITVVTVVLLALVDLSKLKEDPIARVGSLIAFVLVGTMLLLALRASGLSRRWQRVADVVVWVTVGLMMFITITSAFVALPVNASPAPLLIVGLALIAPPVVVRRLIEHGEVTRATLRLPAHSGGLLLRLPRLQRVECGAVLRQPRSLALVHVLQPHDPDDRGLWRPDGSHERRSAAGQC
jgi:hypothetical protein